MNAANLATLQETTRRTCNASEIEKNETHKVEYSCFHGWVYSEICHISESKSVHLTQRPAHSVAMPNASSISIIILQDDLRNRFASSDTSQSPRTPVSPPAPIRQPLSTQKETVKIFPRAIFFSHKNPVLSLKLPASSLL